MKASIIAYSGFRQDSGPDTGISKLHRRIWQTFPDRNTVFPIAKRVWNDNHKAIAADLVEEDAEVLAVIGYSYGCGHSLVRLADALFKRGRKIDVAYLIDPVPRWRFLPAKLLSMTRKGKYKVPHNVIDCVYWRQVNGSPYGRVPEHPWVRLKCGGVWGLADALEKHAECARDLWHITDDDHSDIDDLPEIHDYIVNDLEKRIRA